MALTTAQMLEMTQREYILLIGKDGAGKTSAMVSIAKWVQDVLNPDATIHIIDSETKFPTAVRSFGPDAPTNLLLYPCNNMNEINKAIDEIMEKRKPGDWVFAESMGRIWTWAQDMGYMAVSGYDKSTYLEKRAKFARKDMPVVIPKPNDFWSIVKGAHDTGFLDVLTQASSLNVVLSTTISKPPVEKPGSIIKENETRKETRVEFGIDSGLDGAPRMATYVETTILFDLEKGRVSCRVLRDNPSPLADTRIEFDVEDKKSWAPTFWNTCR